MDIIKFTTFELSANDVKEIVAEYLVSNGYNVKPHNVELIVDRKIEDFGVGRHEVLYFKACRVRGEG